MSKHLHNHLEELERQLLYLAGQVEEAVRRSITALLQRRMDLAERVIDGDADIDRREVALEEECLKALALHQPVASDLRWQVGPNFHESMVESIYTEAAAIAEAVAAS